MWGESFDDDDDAFARNKLGKIENGEIFFLVYLNMISNTDEINHMQCMLLLHIGKLATIILHFKTKYLACYALVVQSLAG